jgi:hypothetical protein
VLARISILQQEDVLMKKMICLTILLAGLLLQASDILTEAPKGFTWRQMPFIKASVLMPDDWFFSFIPDNREEKYIYHISKENIEQSGVYETGLDFRAMRGVPAKTKGKLPSEYSASAVSDTEKMVKFTKKWEETKGIFKEIGYMYVDSSNEKESISVYRLYISNDKTGTVYVLTFEGPTRSWDELWKNVGEVIFKNLSIDESI